MCWNWQTSLTQNQVPYGRAGSTPAIGTRIKLAFIEFASFYCFSLFFIRSYPPSTEHGKLYCKKCNNDKEIFTSGNVKPQSLTIVKRELPKTYDIYRELLKTMLGDKL